MMTSHSPSPAPFFSARHTPVSVISNHDNSDAPRVRFGGKTERARTASITTGGEHTVSGGGLGSEREGKKDGDWEDELEEDEGDGMAKLTTLCIYSVKARLAASYLDGLIEKLFIMEDVHDTDHFDIAQMVLDQVKPKLVLINSAADDPLIDAVKSWTLKEDSQMEIRPQKEFHYNKSKNRILSLHLPLPFSVRRQHDASQASVSSSAGSRIQTGNAYDFQPRAERTEDVDDDQRSKTAGMRLGGMIDFEKSFSISAAGGLLAHYSRAKARGELPGGDTGNISVNGIEVFTPEAFMQLNADTLDSLQIFDEQRHAYVHSGAKKEGLSLFGILNNTRTKTGLKLLRNWLLRPLLSIKDISARHDAVALFSRPDNKIPMDIIAGLLKGMSNVGMVIGMLRRGTENVMQWKILLEFSYRCVQIKDGAGDLIGSHSTTMIKKLGAAFDATALTTLGQQINDTIDWEESTGANRVCCKEGVDPELDEWKKMYNGLDTLLTRVAEDLQVNVPAAVVQTLNVTYFPQLGFLIAATMVEPWDQDTQDEEVLEGWAFQFATDDFVYFKDAKMRDLDGYFGDIHSNIVDREIEIVHKLSESVLGKAAMLQEAATMCDELDCLISFAEASSSFRYVRPFMTEENSIVIKNGRHPLQEFTVDTYISNPTKLHGGWGIIQTMSDDGDDQKMRSSSDDDPSSTQGVGIEGKKSVMVLTGSNQSGKSVYGKAVALIVFMAQIGCFVPCDGATIGICDKIFTRLSTKESVAKPQSSFMIDLSQISYALRNATPRSLLIVDEGVAFGKGTISTDGAGLLAGVIIHLLNRGDRCPKTIAMTHFHELFTHNFLPKSLPIFYASMEIKIEEKKPKQEHGTFSLFHPVSYLYKLVPDRSLTSHAAACARSQGMPDEIVDRSIEVGALISRFEFLPLQNRQLSEEEKGNLSHAERVLRSFLSSDFSPSSFSGDVREKLAGVLELDTITTTGEENEKEEEGMEE